MYIKQVKKQPRIAVKTFASHPELNKALGAGCGALLYEKCLSSGHTTLKDAPFLYTYGYEFIGLAYSVYLHRVIEKVKQFEIDHLIFVAREGYLFQKIYQILQSGATPMLDPAVSTHYACLSRVSTLLASTPQLTTREIALATEKPGEQGLADVLKILGLPVDEFLPYAQLHQIDLSQPLTDYWNNQPLLNFLNNMDMQAQVRQHYQAANHKLQQYLDQCQFWGKNRKVALVDIGWQGTIQDNLTRAFNHRDDFPLLHGFYFGRREIQTFLRYSSSLSHGLVYDARDGHASLESIQLFVGMFEQAASAPHASTIGYDDTPQGVVPRLAPNTRLSRQNELQLAAPTALLQQGILDFAQQYKQCWNQQRFTATSQLPFLQGLITRHIAFPTYEEAFHLSKHFSMPSHLAKRASTAVYGSGNPEATSQKPKAFSTFIVSKADFWHAIKRGKLKTAKAHFEAAIWKPGSLRLLNIPGFASIYRIKRFLFPTNNS